MSRSSTPESALRLEVRNDRTGQPSLRNTNMEFQWIRDRRTEFDVVSLGDVVTTSSSATEGAVHVRVDDDGRWLEIPLGTKLVIEDDSLPATGGSAANAAVAMARLGLRVAWPVISPTIKLGSTCSVRCAARRRHEPHTRRFAESHRSKLCPHTGAERTILVRHADFNYKWKVSETTKFQLAVHQLPRPDALAYQDELADWLDSFPNVRLAFQPGTFQLERVPNDSLVFTPEPNCSSAAVPPQYHHWYFLERLEAPSR